MSNKFIKLKDMKIKTIDTAIEQDKKWLLTAFQSNFGINAMPTEEQEDYFCERVSIMVVDYLCDEYYARSYAYDELFRGLS